MSAVTADSLREPTAGRRLQQAGLAVAAVCLLAAAALWLAPLVKGWTLFPLRHVTLDGSVTRVSEAELRSAIAPHIDGGLLTLNVSAIHDAVEALAWVKSASVRRVFPHSLIIDITEQQALARWGGGAGVNTDGELFHPEALPEGLPRLSGPEGRHGAVAERYRRLRPILAGAGMTLTGLRMDARGAWRAELADGAVLALGTDDIESRVRRFVAAWPRLERAGEAPLASADLRYPNGFAVRWQQAAQRRKD